MIDNQTHTDAEVARGAALLATGERLVGLHRAVVDGSPLDVMARRLLRLAADFARDHPSVIETLIGETVRLREAGGPTASDLVALAHLCAIDDPAAAAIRANIAELAALDDAVEPTATAN